MYVVYSHGFDAYLTTKGWIRQTYLMEEKYNLIIVGKSANLVEIVKNLEGKYSTTIAKGVELISEKMLLNNSPKDINMTKEELNLVKSGVPSLVSILVKNNAKKVSSKTVFNKNMIKQPIVEPEIITTISSNSTSNSTSTSNSKSKKKTQNIDDLARVKRELQYDSEFMKKTMLLTQNINQTYTQAKEIALYYPIILKELDGQIQDELHYVEFHKLNMFKAHKLSKKLHKLRVKRRNIKDKISTAYWILAELDEEKVNSLNQIAFKLEKLEMRRYLIRDPKSFKRNIQKTAEIE